MKLMAAEDFTPAHQQAIDVGASLAVTQAEGTPGSPKRQHTGHGMETAVLVGKLLTQEQQPTAFGHHRQPPGHRLAQAGQGLPGSSQLGSPQLGVATRQQHSPGARG